MPADVSISAPELVAVAAQLKEAGGTLRKDMGKMLRAIAVPLVAAERSAALGLESNGTAGGQKAQVERAAWYLRRSKFTTGKKGQPRQAMSAQQVSAKAGKAYGKSGLRASISRSITAEYRESGNYAGLAVRARGSSMPPSQRALVKASNRGKGWRHPVYGNKNVWVTQTMLPANWFDRTGLPYVALAKTDAAHALGEFTTKLAEQIRSDRNP